MNYRHAYHAGNFADVLKHAVLALVLEYMKRKPAPLRVIDTHAGVGVYDLNGIEAGKTGEWQGGIGQLEAEALPPDIAALLAPYLQIVRATRGYPGSPEVARRLLRADDALVLNELHLADYQELAARYAQDARITLTNLDAWVAVKALLPPPERRGLILIDPPYEDKDEFAHVARGLKEALRRFATGTFLLWYPVKDMGPVEAFHAGLHVSKSLRLELYTRAPDTPHRLNGCGLLAVNPPFTLEAQMRALLPFLAARLKNGPGEGWLVQN